MKLKKLGTALFAVLALGAMMVSSASAAAVTEDVQWYTGSSPGTLLSGSATAYATGAGELITEVGSTPLVLTYDGLECIECKIENVSGKATGTGKLDFTVVFVSTPATCKVSGGSVTTKPLTISPDFMIGSRNFVRFVPTTGTTFATLKLEEGSGSCPLSGSYIVSGSDFVESVNATGIQATPQPVRASGVINKEAGGELKFGAKIASLNSTNSALNIGGGPTLTPFGTH